MDSNAWKSHMNAWNVWKNVSKHVWIFKRV